MASRAVHQSFHKCPSQLHTFGHQLTCLAHGDDIQIMLLWLTMLLSTSVQLLYSCPWLPCLLFLKTFACQAACASLENTHVCCSWFAHLCWCALELTCFASRLALTWLLVPFDACVAPSCSFIFSLVPPFRNLRSRRHTNDRHSHNAWRQQYCLQEHHGFDGGFGMLSPEKYGLILEDPP